MMRQSSLASSSYDIPSTWTTSNNPQYQSVEEATTGLPPQIPQPAAGAGAGSAALPSFPEPSKQQQQQQLQQGQKQHPPPGYHSAGKTTVPPPGYDSATRSADEDYASAGGSIPGQSHDSAARPDSFYSEAAAQSMMYGQTAHSTKAMEEFYGGTFNQSHPMAPMPYMAKPVPEMYSDDFYGEAAPQPTGFPGGMPVRPSVYPAHVLPMQPMQMMPPAAAFMGGMTPAMPWQGTVMTADEAAIVEEPWYYRNINRQDAEAMLRPEKDGCFVVRPGRVMDTFVLSVKTGGQYSHIELTAKVVTGLRGQIVQSWLLGGFSHPHESVKALINYHRVNPIEIDGRPWVKLIDPQKERIY